MSRCWNCGMELQDPSSLCPLCRCVVEHKQSDTCEMTYPKTVKKVKKIQRALSIYMFAAIAAEVVLLLIDMQKHAGWMWTLLIGVFMVYGYITLRVSIVMKTGYRLKLILQTLLGILVVMAIDLVTGHLGWSVNYVLPAAFVWMDVAIVVLMFVNIRNWQSYLPMQILVIILCVVPFVLYHYHITTTWLLSCIAMSVAVLTFLGSLIIGGKRARTELYRRFHI